MNRVNEDLIPVAWTAHRADSARKHQFYPTSASTAATRHYLAEVYQPCASPATCFSATQELPPTTNAPKKKENEPLHLTVIPP